VDTTQYELYSGKFTVSRLTLDFWEKQGGFQPSNPECLSPFRAVSAFIHWVTTVTADTKEWVIWAKGPQFDLSILYHHMKVFTLKRPWRYNQERDVRSIEQLAEEMRLGLKFKRNDHHALRDAINQRDLTQRVYDTLGRNCQIAREALISGHITQSSGDCLADTGLGTTPGMWQMVSEHLSLLALPDPVNRAIYKLCEGNARVGLVE
jgi:3' exoribonuclease, RNase T-like